MHNSNTSQQSAWSKKEEAILARWKELDIFQKTLLKDSPQGEYIFYEGPPGVNGGPMLHHFEARAFKDVMPRYKTMRGYHCDRRAGWDCHGLPVELQTEKELGLTSKSQIEEIGIDVYNSHCRGTVGRYTAQWESFSERMGYWVDYKRAYFTMHNSFIESAWNIVSEANTRGLLYLDYKVLPWCTHCGTSLSSHELGQPGAYKDVKDLSVCVKFKLEAGQSIVDWVTTDNTYILAWTTTPWTLPANVALAVARGMSSQKDVDANFYRIFEVDQEVEGVSFKKGDVIILMDSAVNRVIPKTFFEKGLKLRPVGSRNCYGEDLAGLSYSPLYNFLTNIANETEGEKLKSSYKIYAADFVTTTDGTGVVHIAPMYGADDFELASQYNLPKVHVVNEDGTYKVGCGFLAGRYVKEKSADGVETVAVDIIKDLASRGLLFKKEKYEHSYPHCWRCLSPLLYFARSSWYFRMSALRSDLLKINNDIRWEPAHIQAGRFGEWLENIKDWAVSRSRYWGTPLPVWQTADGSQRHVVGSLRDVRALVKRSGNMYYAMRHGRSEANDLGVWSVFASNEHHLTSEGRLQVIASVQELKGSNITKIVASPFLRTRETALLVAQELGLSAEDIVFDSRLGEYNPGADFNNLDRASAGLKWSSLDSCYLDSFEGGESLRDLCARTGEFLHDLDSKFSNENILCISHMSPIIMLQLHSSVTTQSPYDYYHAADSFSTDAIQNAQIVPLDFVPYPHNAYYELDMHRPYIDDIQLQTPDGQPLSRVTEVMDVWFDSGCVPLAQEHYPFENSDLFIRGGYPADYICEAIDQTRGWFYTLTAVAALIGKPTPFTNVICLGHILDAAGQKMSKSKGNTVDSIDIMSRFSADILRWWMYSVTQPGDSKNFDESGLSDIQSKVFMMLDNCIAFWKPYRSFVSAGGYVPNNYVLDDWITARFNQLHADVTSGLDDYKIFESVRAIREFIADLSQWYIRRSRDRIKHGDDAERASVATTLHQIFTGLAKILAPFAPFYAEALWIDLGHESESVHLEDWDAIRSPDTQILEDMTMVRSVVSFALEKRARAGVKVRQPLSRLLISNKLQYLNPAYLIIIAEELNVKHVFAENNGPIDEVVLDTVLTDELLYEGDAREIIRSVQELRKKSGLVATDEVVLVFSALPEYLSSYMSMIMSVTGARTFQMGEPLDAVRLHDDSTIFVGII